MTLKIDHVTLALSSLEKSIPYYDKLLSLLEFEKTHNHVWTDGNGFFFQFIEAKEGTSAYERYGAGMNHIGFSAPSPEFVINLRNAMQSSGFEVPSIQNFKGVTALFMKDPDGIRFEVTYYPPGVSVVD